MKGHEKLRKEEIKKEIINAVSQVKSTRPMAPSITNSVTINLVANAQIAVGGSAAMVYLPDEAETMAKVASAMYINVGTLLPIYEETLPRCAKALFEEKKQWVVDPVAVGIGGLRNKLLYDFKKYKPSIIRGNASEVMALAGLWELDGGEGEDEVRGVDSKDAVEDAKLAAISIAKYTEGAVAISGEVDFVTYGKLGVYSYGGSHYFEKITGAGCALAGVMAVYACCANPFIAALTGTNIFNFAGKIAEEKCSGPGSFEVEFLDALYNARAEEISSVEFEFEKL